MRSFSYFPSLQSFCLSIFFLSCLPFLGTAAPVPINGRTQYASTHDPAHASHLPPQPPHGHPPLPTHLTTVHDGEVPHAGPPGAKHFMGTVGIAPEHLHGLTPTAFHDHLEAVKQGYQNAEGRRYEVSGHHTPGEAFIRFHAAPADHIAKPHTTVLHPGSHSPDSELHPIPKENADIMDRTLSSLHHNGDTRFSQQPNGPNGGLSGTIPVGNHRLRGGMGSGSYLQHHAKWINDNLLGDNKDKAHIHVTHTPGSDHVSYQAIPAHTGTTMNMIQGHLHDSGVTPYQGRPHTSNKEPASDKFKDHQYTFAGKVPAHTTAGMTPQELDLYAQHVESSLKREHGLQGTDRTDMVVATTHKAGDDYVHFSTQPKHKNLYDLGKGKEFPKINQALKDVGSVSDDGTPLNHAEMAVLRNSLRSKGTTAQTFDRDLTGHVLGVSGSETRNRWDKPCPYCHAALQKLGPGKVTYTGMNAPITT